MKKLNLNAIRSDGGTQSRVSLNEATVAEYIESLDSLPPLVVFFDGADHWLADGFHRLHAYRQAGKASVPVDVRTGTQREAVLFSLGANASHGLRRSNADKRKAVQTLLDDAEWSQWSDRKIAEACGVSQPFVSGMRKPAEVITVITPVPGKEATTAATVAASSAGKVESDSTNQRPEQAPKTAAQAASSLVEKESLKSASAEEPEYFGPTEEEIAEAQREQDAEMAALRLVIEADDKLSAAVAEVKRLTALNRVLEERINGLMNEKNAALQAAKSWQRKAEKAARALKEAA